MSEKKEESLKFPESFSILPEKSNNKKFIKIENKSNKRKENFRIR